MKRILLCLSLFLLIGISSFSQNFINAYTNKTTFSNSGSIDRITTDNMNNVINATMFSGTIEVGGNSYTNNGLLSTMIIKRDDNDSLIWAKKIGCENLVIVCGLYTDNQSNLYVTGYFGDSLNATTLDCTPFQIVNPDGYNVFVIKYDPAGNVLWSNSINISTGPANSNADLFRIVGNGTDRIAISSFLFNGVGQQTIGSSIIDPANGNLFFAVIDENGNWQFAKELGGSSLHLSLSMAMAANNELFISGEFRGSLILGAAGTLTTLTSSPQDFIIKADANGDFSWAKMIDGSSWWRTEVLTDGSDVLLLGSFGNDLTFGSTTLFTSIYSTYMTKIDNAGNYLWAKKYGTYETTLYCATKKNNRIYITGNTSPSYPGNVFDTLNMVYVNSLSPANTYSSISYLIETDLDGNALKGSAYSFSFPTLNTQSMASSDTKTYLTGNAGGIASFGGIVIDPIQSNSANYVAVYSDSANLIQGMSYYDFNTNNIFDGIDKNCPAKLTLTKGPITQTTMINGNYKVGTDKGTYVSTITDSPLYYTYSPVNYTSTFANLSNQIDSLNDFAFQPISGQNDLVIDLVLGALRPGFSGSGFVNLKNIGTTVKSGLMSVILNNPDITITACTPTATSIVNNSASLSYNLNPTDEITYVIQYYVAPTAVLSSNVLGTASAPDVTDLTPSNNIDSVQSVITGSYDPNSKEVFPAGDITPDFITNGTDLEYIINFQNTGTDTAFTVVLRDTISQYLNLNSFKYISSSHPVEINFYGNEIWFRFYDIHLPDSNTNEPLSHGYVKYTIVPMNTCVLGDEIENTAYIYFDYNTPIITNTTNTLVAVNLGITENLDNIQTYVFPNPNTDNFVNVKSTSPIQTISIYNINGQLMNDVNVNPAYQTTIATNGLAEGVYFIFVTTETGSTKHKLIKIK